MAFVHCLGITCSVNTGMALVRCLGITCSVNTGMAFVHCLGITCSVNTGMAFVRCLGITCSVNTGMALDRCLGISPPISSPVSYRKQRDVFNNVAVPARGISPPGPFDAKVGELGRDGPPHAFFRRDRQ